MKKKLKDKIENIFMITICDKTYKITDFIKDFNQSPNYCNPRNGTSVILEITNGYISYKRGNTKMAISVDLINKIFNYIIINGLVGKRLYTKDIVNIRNKVYPTYIGWHDCDGTFIMMIFRFVLGKTIHDKSPCYIIM